MSAHKQKVPAQRYTIELSPEYQKVIAELSEVTGLRTQKDVFETSIAMLAWAAREVARGRIITSLNEATNTYAELQMPALLAVAQRAEEVRAREKPAEVARAHGTRAAE